MLNEVVLNSINKFLIEDTLNNSFSLRKLNDLQPQDKLEYAYNKLEEIGKGSSRIAFSLNDNYVLKLAFGKLYGAGIEQNKKEWKNSKNINSQLLTKNLYHSPDFSFMVSEQVIPCEPIDFLKILGISYRPRSCENNDELEMEKKTQDKYGNSVGYRNYNTNPIDEKKSSFIFIRRIMIGMIESNLDAEKNFPIEYNIIMTHPWFNELYNLAKNKIISLYDIGLENLGITMRNNKPFIVILDSGWDEEIEETFY